MSIVCAIQQFNVSSVWQISRYLIRLAYFMGTIFLSKVATYFSGKLTHNWKNCKALFPWRGSFVAGSLANRKKGVGPPKWLSWPFWGLRITWDVNRLSFVSPLVVDFSPWVDLVACACTFEQSQPLSTPTRQPCEAPMGRVHARLCQ